MPQKLPPEVLTLHREYPKFAIVQEVICTQSQTYTASSKVWDTYSGAVLHSFPHNHIVRTVALSPSASHLLTAGNEKKVRLFDLTRPDAAPSYMKREGGIEAHAGTIKSVIWDADRAVGVSAGDDKVIR